MTTRERERLRPEISQALELVHKIRADVALDNQEDAQEGLRMLTDWLVGLEGRVGCYTPMGLFEEAET